jgi:hypothetical protein
MKAAQIKDYAERATMALLYDQGGPIRLNVPHIRRARKKQRERDVVEDILFELTKAA